MELPSGPSLYESWDTKNPCVDHLLALEAELQERGLRPGELRVGQLVGIVGLKGEFRDDLPAPMAGLGAHSSFETHETDAARALLLETLKNSPPGTVSISAWNGALGSQFKDFALGLGPDLFKQYGPQDLHRFLSDQANQLARLAAGDYEVGTAMEPHRLALLIGDGKPLEKPSHELLETIMNSQTKGVTVLAVGIPNLQSNRLQQSWDKRLKVQVNDTPAEEVRERCGNISEQAKLGSKPPALESVLPAWSDSELMQKSAIEGLEVVLGVGPDGKPYRITLSGADSHVLNLAGTGGGKTLEIKTIVASLSAYSPNEVSLIAVDGKRVEFNTLAPSEREPDWQVHARLVAANVNRDPEFQRAVFEHLHDEMASRSQAMTELGVVNYEDLRRADPSGHWPRLLVVIDEFQEMFKGAHGRDMVDRLEDIARKGRALGIHLLLASQSVRGIEAFYGRYDIFKNFGVNILGVKGSIPNQPDDEISRRAEKLPPLQLLVSRSSQPDQIVSVRVPAAYEDHVKKYRQRTWQIWRDRQPDAKPPVVFDGSVVPKLSEARDIQELRPAPFSPRTMPPVAKLAKRADLKGTSAEFSLDRSKGRNLALIGRPDEAYRIMHSAAVSLAKQQAPEHAKFVVVCLDGKAAPAAGKVIEELSRTHAVETVEAHNATEFFRKTSDKLAFDEPGDSSTFILVYGGDSGAGYMSQRKKRPLTTSLSSYETKVYDGSSVEAGDVIAVAKDGSPLLAPGKGRVEFKSTPEGDKALIFTAAQSGQECFMEVAELGPEKGVHIVSTWSNDDKFKDVTLGHMADFRGYVTLGVESERLPWGSVSTADRTPTGKDRGRYRDLDDGTNRPSVIIPYSV